MKYEKITCLKCGGFKIRSEHLENRVKTGICKYCNGRGQIKSDYLIITDPVEKMVFYDYEVFEPTVWNDDYSEITWSQNPIILDKDELGIDEIMFTDKPIKVHKSIVKEVCEKDKRAFLILSYGMTIEQLNEFTGYLS